MLQKMPDTLKMPGADCRREPVTRWPPPKNKNQPQEKQKTSEQKERKNGGQVEVEGGFWISP